MKDQWWICETLSHLQPVPKIIADVVTAERKHGHRIAPDSSNCASGGSGGLRGHRGANIDAMFPVERLKDKGHRVAPPATKNDCADRNATSLFDMRIEHWIIAHRCGETAVRMGRFLFRCRCPAIAPPIDRVCGRRSVLSFPPGVTVISERDVGVNRVVLNRTHRVRV